MHTDHRNRRLVGRHIEPSTVVVRQARKELTAAPVRAIAVALIAISKLWEHVKRAGQAQDANESIVGTRPGYIANS